MEQATTTVYAQGGRGNTRLVAWEGEKTLTFTMEDALISEMGLAILAGANLYKAGTAEEVNGNTLVVHVTETGLKPAGSAGSLSLKVNSPITSNTSVKAYALKMDDEGEIDGDPIALTGTAQSTSFTAGENKLEADALYLVDYYTDVADKATQIDIEPQSFGGNFYIEADTLFRDTTGVDHAAQFIIPNGKVQSNFTLTMASSGDPSTFTFTVDAFPGYVNGDLTKKVLSAIQVVENNNTDVIISDAAGDIDTDTATTNEVVNG